MRKILFGIAIVTLGVGGYAVGKIDNRPVMKFGSHQAEIMVTNLPQGKWRVSGQFNHNENHLYRLKVITSNDQGCCGGKEEILQTLTTEPFESRGVGFVNKTFNKQAMHPETNTVRFALEEAISVEGELVWEPIILNTVKDW